MEHTPKAASALRLMNAVNRTWQAAHASKDWARTSRCRRIWDKLRARWIAGRFAVIPFTGATIHFADPIVCTCRVRLDRP